MLLEHFGLKKHPFNTHIDSSLLWYSKAHTVLMDQLLLSIELQRGMMLLNGPTGSGKTIFIRNLIRHLPETIQVVYISSTNLSFNQLLQIICRDLGIRSPEGVLNNKTLLNMLYQHLLEGQFQGRKYCLILDNVQHMHPTVLEHLTELDELETSVKKMLSVVLIGNEETNAILSTPGLEGLNRKMVSRFSMPLLSETDMVDYIQFTIKLAGYEGSELFHPRAVKRIYDYSGGIFQSVNKLCSDALMLAYSRKKKRVEAGYVKEVYDSRKNELPDNRLNPIDELPVDAIRIDSKRGWCSQEEFSEILHREKLRSDRNGMPLSYILIDLPLDPQNNHLTKEKYYDVFKKLISLINQKTRTSDIKYILETYKIGILLTDTSLDGAKAFIEKLAGALFDELESLNRIENVKFIKNIVISSYPLNQVKDFDRIEGTPVILKNLKFKKNGGGNGKQNSLKESALLVKQDARVLIDWSFVTNPDGTIHISTPVYQDILSREMREKTFHFLKRAMDLLGALLGLILLAPAMSIIALAIKLTSPGPVLFRQKRVGRFKKEFTFYKFRTMYIDADDKIHREYVTSLIKGKGEKNQTETGEMVFKLVDDPRVTKIGRFLRKTSLDELPQLFNVLNGSMSLVGPRPPIPYEVNQYKNWHLRRILEVKPGVTGLWQVYGRSRTTFDEMVRLDLQYVEKQSPLLDLKILLNTFWVVFKSDGAY
ncbi:MAG: hypothetical protein Kow0037_29310 [Calditrichia bacterium]